MRKIYILFLLISLLNRTVVLAGDQMDKKLGGRRGPVEILSDYKKAKEIRQAANRLSTDLEVVSKQAVIDAGAALRLQKSTAHAVRVSKKRVMRNPLDKDKAVILENAVQSAVDAEIAATKAAAFARNAATQVCRDAEAKANAARNSSDLEVVAAQAALDAKAALKVQESTAHAAKYALKRQVAAAQAALDAQVAAAQNPLNAELAKIRDTKVQAALDAQIAASEAVAYAQTIKDSAKDASTQAYLKQTIARIEASHGEETAALRGIVKVLCFPGETPISVKNNSRDGYHAVPISSVEAGDAVVSCNLELKDGACEIGKVHHVFNNTTDRLIKLSFDGKSVRATDSHPFYVVDKKNWIEARNLRVGDRLRSISGEAVTIDDIEIEEGEFNVYNLDVEGNHNYYACDVLVHNCNKLGIELPEGFDKGDSDSKTAVPVVTGSKKLPVKSSHGNRQAKVKEEAIDVASHCRKGISLEESTIEIDEKAIRQKIEELKPCSIQ